MEPLKIVVCGDGTVGKTCLVLTYAQGSFPQMKYVPTIVDELQVDVPIKGKLTRIHLYDTAGQENYQQLRSLAYIGANVFLLCFAIDNFDSFQNVSEVWKKELRQTGETTPILLVGTKCDRRKVLKESEFVDCDSAARTAFEIGAVKYMECSALENICVNETVNEAIVAAIAHCQKRSAKDGGCCSIS